MLTRNKLLLNVAVSIVAAAAMGTVLFGAVQEAREETADNEMHLEIVRHVTQLRFAMVDYLNSGNERAIAQWESESRKIEDLIRVSGADTIDAEMYARLQRNLAAAKSVLRRLVAASSGADGAQGAVPEEFRQGLFAQLMGRSQDMEIDALRVSARGIAAVHAALRRVVLVTLGITLLGVALVCGNWAVVQIYLLGPMRKLEAATASIAAGNEAARSGLPARTDELGNLARSFDAMAEALQQRTASLQKANRGLTNEISERNKVNVALDATARNLAQSNAELEQFAYVASHDMQEPLRMVVSYVQMLEKRLAGRLDADTREFMGYAVEGALRLQHLILDILDYSRVSSQGQPLAPVDSTAALDAALTLLASRIAESGAKIEAQSLPIVMVDQTQLVQLFQNLISNAIKFCRDSAPRVRVEAVHEAGWWRFLITDNGIGIAPEYRAQIFVIFKRLHSRREFPGTGIGLAICKRIVERHGGEIGVDAAPGGGSVFWFTLPDENSVL